MANSVDSYQTAPIGAYRSSLFWVKLFAFLLNSSVMLGNYLQQMTSADDVFRLFSLGAFRVKVVIYMNP